MAAFALIGSAALAATSACASTEEATERLCTPKAYVLCTCKDGQKGTKQCAKNGASFGACDSCQGANTEVASDDISEAEGEGAPRPKPPPGGGSSGSSGGKPSSSGAPSSSSGSSGNPLEPACAALASCCDAMSAKGKSEASTCSNVVATNSDAVCASQADRYRSFGFC